MAHRDDGKRFIAGLRRALIDPPDQPGISAKPVGVGAVSQRLIPTGERSGLQTHIATTESISLCMPMRS